MKFAPSRLHSSLIEWKSRRCLPEEGEPGYDAFFTAASSLVALYGARDFVGTADKLTTHQRRAGAMLAFSNAMPWDGLVIGVIVNQPEVIAHVREAAAALNLRRVASLITKMRTLIPPGVFQQSSVDDRMASLDADPNTAKLHALEDSDLAEDARCDMMVAAMRLVLDHPEEFFKSAKTPGARAAASKRRPKTPARRRGDPKNRSPRNA